MTWIPTNASVSKMCGTLLIAHRKKMISLEYIDALRVRDVCLNPYQCQKTKILVARLWRRHNGMKLAEELDRVKIMPQNVVEELQGQETA